jgi:ABC-2 type transport system ATP-binding protein
MIDAVDLRKEYGDVVAVSGSTFSVESGEIFGLIGPNGAGKTTTLKMLAGLLEPTAGEATVAGFDSQEREMRRHLGFLPEDSPVYEHMTARSYLHFFADLYDVPDEVADERIESTLDRLDLEVRNRPLGNTSKGMKRKVAIARSLVNDPEVLIYDEPASGLDPLTTNAIIDFVSDLGADRTVVFSAHNLYHVEALCDRVAMLLDGELSVTGTIEEIRAAGERSSAITELLPITDRAAARVLTLPLWERMTVEDVLNDFLDKKAFQYAQVQLARQDPTVTAQMKEYRDGLLAFRFMQDSIWTAAAQDTTELRRLYKQQRNTYRFPERIRTIEFRAPADSLLRALQSDASDTTHATLVKKAETDSLVTVDTIMVTEDSPDVYRRVDSLQDGAVTGPIRHEGTSRLFIRDQLLLPRTKTFEEAKSAVMRDYQDQYEKTVLSRLRKRYNVETYPERLRHAFPDAQRNHRPQK